MGVGCILWDISIRFNVGEARIWDICNSYHVGVGCIWDLLLSDVCGRLLLIGGADAAYIGILPFLHQFYWSLDNI